jgi:hypothetical protein
VFGHRASCDSFVKRLTAGELPSVAQLDAVRSSMLADAHRLGLAPAAVDGLVKRAQWFARARVSRPQYRFVAMVHVGYTLELPSPVVPGAGVAAAVAVVNLRDDPARVNLGRVVGFFYAPPPVSGSDGLPSAPPRAPCTLLQQRMFVVVWPFQGQTLDCASQLEDHGLLFHAIRSPEPLLQPGGRLPLAVYPLSAVLRAVLVRNAAWPGTLPGTQVHRYGNSVHDAASGKRKEAAAAHEGDILVFWPPDRDTFLPPLLGAGPPVLAEGANEPVPEDEEDGDDE